MAAASKAASAALRVIGPIVSSVVDSGNAPSVLTSPPLVFSPVMPLSAAGMRTEPPVSEPIAAGASPAATATPDPLDDPPGTRCVARSHGFHGVPRCGLVPQVPNANSTICVLPSGTMPAASRWRTTAAVVVLIRCFHGAEPTPVGKPSTSSRSFNATGTPSSGPSRSPLARRSSAARA